MLARDPLDGLTHMPAYDGDVLEDKSVPAADPAQADECGPAGRRAAGSRSRSTSRVAAPSIRPPTARPGTSRQVHPAAHGWPTASTGPPPEPSSAPLTTSAGRTRIWTTLLWQLKCAR